MTDDDVLIENLPDVRDINVMLEAIEEIGATVERIDRHTAKINASSIHEISVDDEYIRKIRASYYFIGALLGKYKSAQVPLPGGCNIGSRPIDQHLKGFRALGGDVRIENGAVRVHAIDLVGSHIYLDVVSVGATINIMMAAALAEGMTILENVAKEPHVVDVANFLNSMGANIKGAGTDTIRIRGVKKLHGTEYSIIPDQIEAGTFMCAAAITRGDIMVKNVIPKHLEAITAKLLEAGCEVSEFDDAVRVVGKPVQRHTDIKTLPYPGFPTDMQPQMTVTLALAEGTSMVTESIFENRFKYVDELARMGSNIKVKNVIPKHLEAITAKLLEAGCEVSEFDDAERVVGKPVQRHTDIKTLPYPGFPTDMQPQMTVTLALAEGTSMVTESIFENRFKYVDELARMGSNIKVEGNVAVIDGVKRLTGAQVNAPDLRAGAALVLAGLAAEGITEVDEIGYIQRGYECFEEKLRALGALIEKVDSEKEAQKFRLKVG